MIDARRSNSSANQRMSPDSALMASLMMATLMSLRGLPTISSRVVMISSLARPLEARMSFICILYLKTRIFGLRHCRSLRSTSWCRRCSR